MTRYTILPSILFLLLLSSCTSKGPGDKYLKQISSSINKDYNLQNGELIAKYNLIDTSRNGKCLFAKNYGLIVSDVVASQKFLNSVRVHLKDTDVLQLASRSKISAIYNNITAINAKYNVVSKRDLEKLKSLVSLPTAVPEESPFDLLDPKQQKISANHFANLASVDNSLRYIPVFLPQTHTSMTSPFGKRTHPIYGEMRFHQGTDFAANKHAMIHAAADGKILEVARSKSYGNFILIEHGGMFRTRYAHLSRLLVDARERVFQGQLIGLQGSSGNATGDHLHFEVIYKGTPVDPMFFVASEYRCRES